MITPVLCHLKSFSLETNKQMRDRRLQNRISLALGVILVFAMGASLILPLLSNVAQSAQQTIPPTSTPVPTVPAPVENLESIAFTQSYLHPSGLFTATIPTGWTVSSELNNTGEAQVSMQNSAQLSVIEIRVTRPTAEQDITTTEGVSTIFDNSWLASSWSGYTSWTEADRKIEDSSVIIDFNLNRAGQDYIARQESFTDGTWVYSVRVITPSNASQMLRHVLENEVASLQPVEQYVGAPMEWNAYYDETADYVIRYPGLWTVADSAPGAPVSISGDNTQLRVEVLPNAIDSEETASAYVQGLRSGTTVLSVEPVEQFGASGFNVAYTLATLDGDTQSGLVTILNDDSGSHAANVLLTNVSNTDLNTVDIAAADTAQAVKDAIDLLASFALNPEINLATTETE
jgi:hypothetical protein